MRNCASLYSDEFNLPSVSGHELRTVNQTSISGGDHDWIDIFGWTVPLMSYSTWARSQRYFQNHHSNFHNFNLKIWEVLELHSALKQTLNLFVLPEKEVKLDTCVPSLDFKLCCSIHGWLLSGYLTVNVIILWAVNQNEAAGHHICPPLGVWQRNWRD